MKGTLHKTEKGWMVSRCVGDGVVEVWEETLPLHPDFIELMDTCFTSKFTQEVEFEIVNIVSNKNTLSDDDNVLLGTFAKIINHISDISKMVEVPQQEISDEEIEKFADEELGTIRTDFDFGVIQGMKWYREKLKCKGNENKSNSSI
jgi:hypothetical protein